MSATTPTNDPAITAESLGPDVPRRGTPFTQRLGLLLLKVLGWKITGVSPTHGKALLIGAPHTSNRDGLVAAGTIMALRLNITVLAKAELFKGPLGSFFRWANVMPVYRNSNKGGQVEQVVARFAQPGSIYIGIAPEGTRHSPDEWKLGFYYMAHRAGVPIIPFILDFGRKELRITEAFFTTGDKEADLAALQARYRDVIPANPARLSGPLRRLSEQ